MGLSQNQIDKWYNVVRVQFPVYVKYWEEHNDEKERVPLLQEHVFDIPYELPSGRVVRLRGKMDGVDLINGEGIYLQENKTKSVIDVASLNRQLKYDLQTMMYLIALRLTLDQPDEAFVADEFQHPVRGVRYNVIKRALSGGTGSIRQKKPTKSNPTGESSQEYYARLAAVISDKDDEFFARWKVDISTSDYAKFTEHTLDPILENLCDDYEWWEWCRRMNLDSFSPELDRHDLFPHHYPRHFRYPYGIRNMIAEGGFGDLDDYINHGSTVGLCNSDKFFRELA